MEKLLLEPGNYYHIYNRGNNGQNIFFEEKNYVFFLNRYDRYISPFCETIAWVLLQNHFHFLIYVRQAELVNVEKLEYSTVEKPQKLDVHLQFGHLFNSYAKAINKRYNRTGSLFEKNFERKKIESVGCLKDLVHFVHYNPVNHRFVSQVEDYPWCSYSSVISNLPTKISREFVLRLFGNVEEYKLYHRQNRQYGDEINDLLIDL
ncbi:hypothetical protein [Kaistella palustris]|uniref:hypothetical protein n=1 Tax=Kaistella palustris TaxID=493376 RepID=UPI00042A2EF4|nr:hypothetical protein [Kaistella palustris]